MLLDGFEVYTTEPNRLEDLDDQILRQLSKIDNRIGNPLYGVKHDATPRMLKSYVWLLHGRNEIADFKQWIDTKKGRLKTFWIPTWTRDLEIVEDSIEGSMSIIVKGHHYSRLYKAHTSRKRIVLFKYDGTFEVLKITAVEMQNNNNTDKLILSAALARDINKSDVRLICLLLLCRFNTDDIELFWHNREVVTIKMPLIEVPKEVPS